MNSNQRSQGNNQSDNGGNEKAVSSSRGGTVQQDGGQREQSIGQQGSQMGQQSTDRTGFQSGSEQHAEPAERESNDAAGGYPRSPGGSHLAADENMDNDTGLSNRANRQSADDIDNGSKQEKQSNVGRRSDMTPD